MPDDKSRKMNPCDKKKAEITANIISFVIFRSFFSLLISYLVISFIHRKIRNETEPDRQQYH